MVKIGSSDFEAGAGELFFILGACVIESEDQAFSLARSILQISEKVKFNFIYKASFDKANRTSIDSFRGPGLNEGLRIIEKIKNEFKIPVLVDIHLPDQADEVAKVADIIQIPAFLCRQTDLILAAARTGKAINIKKGQFLAPVDVSNVIKKIESAGNKNILITERGTCFGYNNLVVDFTSIPEMKKTGYPVVFDATHSLQLPGGGGNQSGGRRQHVPVLARAAVAAGVDAVFMELHENPPTAKSDSATSFYLSQLEKLTQELMNISKSIGANTGEL